MSGRSRLSALMFILVAAACSSNPGSRSPQTVAAGGFMFVLFENGTAERATLTFDALPVEGDALGNTGGDQRLGQVRGSRNGSFRIEAPPTPFRIVAHYEALDSAFTGRMEASAGDSIFVVASAGGQLTARSNR